MGLSRAESRASRKQPSLDDDHDVHHDGSIPRPLDEDQSADDHLGESASGHAPDHQHDELAPAEPAGAFREDGRDGTSSSGQRLCRRSERCLG